MIIEITKTTKNNDKSPINNKPLKSRKSLKPHKITKEVIKQLFYYKILDILFV